MREEESKITHQFDVWHFVKNIKKRLHKGNKNKLCENLQKWTKSISNHFWWACATCKGGEELLREKWLSVLFQKFKIYTNGEPVNNFKNVNIVA